MKIINCLRKESINSIENIVNNLVEKYPSSIFALTLYSDIQFVLDHFEDRIKLNFDLQFNGGDFELDEIDRDIKTNNRLTILMRAGSLLYHKIISDLDFPNPNYINSYLNTIKKSEDYYRYDQIKAALKLMSRLEILDYLTREKLWKNKLRIYLWNWINVNLLKLWPFMPKIVKFVLSKTVKPEIL